MEHEKILELFDDRCAGADDEQIPATEIDILRRLVGDGTQRNVRWLDLGCGTGRHLSRFPGVVRAGLDLSPAMLERARAANPDVLFLREGDYLEFLPEWQGDWWAVTCLGGAYGYLDSMAQIEQLVWNIVRYTAQEGAAFIPVVDPDVGPGAGAATVDGTIWTHRDDATGAVHEHLLAPTAAHFVSLLVEHFEHIEVVRYPDPAPGSRIRSAVVATRRLPPGVSRLATVVLPPEETTAPEPVQAPEPAEAAAPTPEPEPAPEAPPATAEVRLDTVPTRWILVEARRRLDPRRQARAQLKKVKARLRRVLGG